jgi:hypothetical protein
MARTRYLSVQFPFNPARAQVNELAHRRALVDHRTRAVTTPNNDTLYSSAWLDLSAGPIEFTVPRIANRYWSLHFMDATSNTAELIGNRNAGEGTGGVAGTVLWILQKGDAAAEAVPVPAGARVVRLPTRDAWMLARILVDGTTDTPAVHQIQDNMRLRVVGKPGQAPTTDHPPDPAVPLGSPRDGANYLAVVNSMLARNPLPVTQAFLPGWHSLGVQPGGQPNPQQVAAWTATLPELGRSLRQGLSPSGAQGPRVVAGWKYGPTSIGLYGTDYKTRASVALGGLGALPMVEALYLSATTDSQGQPLRAGTRYRLRVGPEGIQAQSFWSISMYQVEPDGRLFFVDNPIGRYALGDRTQGTVKNADGSLDIVVQAQAPEDAKDRANWLPAPAQLPMQMILRAYLPTEALRNGSAPLPAIEALP